MDEEEARDLQRGPQSARVVKDQLMHQPGHKERGYDCWNWGPPAADGPGRNRPDRIVYGRAHDTGYREVPSFAPEVLEGSGKVGLVELRLEL